jgi:hypothetical protein
MVEARQQLADKFTNNVGAMLKDNKPGSMALAEAAELTTTHPCGYALYTGMLSPPLINTLRGCPAWNKACSDREFAGMIKGMRPAAELASGMYTRRAELLADGAAGARIDGRIYKEGWHVYRGKQHTKNKVKLSTEIHDRPMAGKVAGAHIGLSSPREYRVKAKTYHHFSALRRLLLGADDDGDTDVEEESPIIQVEDSGQAGNARTVLPQQSGTRATTLRGKRRNKIVLPERLPGQTPQGWGTRPGDRQISSIRSQRIHH